MKNIYNIRQIIVSFIVILILSWVFPKNQLIGKIIISPFLVCSIALFGKNLFSLLNKQKIANIFDSIFLFSFLAYIFGILIYTVYYAIYNKSYSLLFIVVILSVIFIILLKRRVFHKK